MATVRSNILSGMKLALESITMVKQVEVGRSIPSDISNVTLPAIFVYSGPSNRLYDNRALIGWETFEWTVVLECWAEDEDMESFLGDIHTRMAIDNTFGRTAEFSEIVSTDILTVDQEKFLEVIVLEYSVLYRHSIGNP